MEGAPEEVMDYYNALLAEREGSTIRQERRDDGKGRTVSGSGEATVSRIALLDASGQPQEVFDVGVPVALEVEVSVRAPIPRLVLGYMIKDRLGQPVYGTNTDLKDLPLHDVRRGERITYRFDFPLNLGAGSYSIAVALQSTDTHLVHNYEWRDLALVFSVANLTRHEFTGCAWIDPQIRIERPQHAEASPAVATGVER
jgi:lipopolysaccharide transport system ATP-binding protein